MKKGFVFTMYIMVLLILFSSCQNKTKNHVIQLVREWEGKEIQFPPNSVFTIQGKDTIKHSGDNCDYKIVTLKSATKLFSVLLASKRPLITELADKLRLKYPLLPTISPCPTMRLEAIRSIIPISCRRYPKSV